MQNKWNSLIVYFLGVWGITYFLTRWLYEEFISDSLTTSSSPVSSLKNTQVIQIKTDVFDNILNEVHERSNETVLSNDKRNETFLPLNNRSSWKNEVLDDINTHEANMYRLQSDKQLQKLGEIDNVINRMKKLYNDDLCKRYVKYFKFDPYSVKMISSNTAEIKPVIMKNTGTYSTEIQKCISNDPLASSVFKCPEYIYCMNGERSTNTSEVLKDYEPVCHYTC